MKKLTFSAELNIIRKNFIAANLITQNQQAQKQLFPAACFRATNTLAALTSNFLR